MKRWHRADTIIVLVTGGLIVIILGVILPLLLIKPWEGKGGSSATQGHTVQGSISLQGDSESSTWSLGQPCSGSGGYSDMRGGAQVVVKNGEGTIVATGELSGGVGENPACSFAFEVDNVPDADFYSIEISHRGAMSFSKSDMESNNWTVALTLGQ